MVPMYTVLCWIPAKHLTVLITEKLFRILLGKNICPLYCSLLLNMYVNQKLTVRWESTYSSYFNVGNGVKQGGVISPILFCIYIDGLLVELEKMWSWLFHGGVYSGAFGYANDLKLLTPTVQAFHILTNICIEYAAKYDMETKCLLMIYKCTKNCTPYPAIIINDVQVPRVHEVIHLGHKLSDDICNFRSTKCVEDFNRQSNIFLANFNHASSNIRNALFQNYCTSFYGQILP